MALSGVVGLQPETAARVAAAVADFRPASASGTKLKKRGLDDVPGEPPAIELVENPDILAGLVTDPPRTNVHAIVVGFAAETGDADGDVLAHGAAKARRKGADLLAINAVGVDTGFGDVPNAVVVVDAQGREVARASGTKAEVGEALVALIADRLPPVDIGCSWE